MGCPAARLDFIISHSGKTGSKQSTGINPEPEIPLQEAV